MTPHSHSSPAATPTPVASAKTSASASFASDPASAAASASAGSTPAHVPRQRRGLPLAGRLGLAGALLAAAVVTYTFTIGAAPAAADTAAATAPAAPRVTVAPVEQRQLAEYREAIGRVDAFETVELRARVSGQIETVHFAAGQDVRAGEVLFTIDPRAYRARAALASAEIQRARARADIAARDARRAEELLTQRAVSLEETDTRRAALAEAQATLAAAEAAHAVAQLDLEHTQVRAPIAGRVSRALVTAGNLVSGDSGSATVLTRLVSTGDAYVYADVDEQTALAFQRLLRTGQLAGTDGRVAVELQLGDETGYPHRGYVESIDNRIDPATGSLVVRMVFANPDGQLIPGVFARVRLPVSIAQPTLLISERAVGTDQSQKFVLTVAADNQVAYRAIKLGPIVEGKRIVRSGLQPGERIIVNGLQRVRSGMTVQPELAAAPPAAKATQVAAR